MAQFPYENVSIILLGRTSSPSRGISIINTNDTERWFTLTMSTGGIALLLAVTPHRFHGLATIGTFVFILDVVLFLLLTSLILIRFYLFPGTFTQSIYHQTESLFIPVRAVHIKPNFTPLTTPPDVLTHGFNPHLRHPTLRRPLYRPMASNYPSHPLLDLRSNNFLNSSPAISPALHGQTTNPSINDPCLDPPCIPYHAQRHRCCRNLALAAPTFRYPNSSCGDDLSRSRDPSLYLHV